MSSGQSDGSNHAPIQKIIDRRPIPSRVLVLGSTGMVGRSWLKLMETEGIECIGVSRPDFDLLDESTIKECIRDGFDLVVNAAAWTDVDGAETQEDLATKSNGDSVGLIAQICESIGAGLISYSTDYVFDGQANEPYSVDSELNPINAYGRSKARGEALLSQSQADCLLIRTSWVYAPWGTNFVRTMRGLIESRDSLNVVNDQRGRPTSAEKLASHSYKLYLSGGMGTWHLSDEGECTWFEFAKHIASCIEGDCQIDPCGSDAFPRPAVRPSYSTLDITESLKQIGSFGDWKSNLELVLRSMRVD